MFDQILIAVDGSEHSRRAATFGLKLASQYDVGINVLYAIEDTPAADDTTNGDHGHPPQADKILEEISEIAADSGQTVATHAVEGQPPASIVNQATETGADLIVMGRQGRTGIGEQMLGNVTDRVLRNTTIPVLVVPDGDSVGATGIAYDRILAPTDGSETAEWASPYSMDIAQHHDATLHLLNVIDPRFESIFSAGGGSEDYFEKLEERGHDFIDQYVKSTEETPNDMDLQKTVVRGTIHEMIDEYVVENDIDLIVMASQGESGLTGQLLGSVTERIIRVGDRPILVVTSST